MLLTFIKAFGNNCLSALIGFLKLGSHFGVIGAVYWIYGVFKVVNLYMYPLVNWAYGAAANVSQLSVGGLLILLLTLVPVPLAAAAGYYCGNSEISLKNKLLYVKEKE